MRKSGSLLFFGQCSGRKLAFNVFACFMDACSFTIFAMLHNNNQRVLSKIDCVDMKNQNQQQVAEVMQSDWMFAPCCTKDPGKLRCVNSKPTTEAVAAVLSKMAPTAWPQSLLGSPVQTRSCRRGTDGLCPLYIGCCLKLTMSIHF